MRRDLNSVVGDGSFYSPITPTTAELGRNLKVMNMTRNRTSSEPAGSGFADAVRQA
ncbi:MAG: hypothetical protein KDC73_00005 [Ignavibacteriae bacterium]|nr:hypothetical protein [Ignavibacteriota bacterium]MCB9242899.1 hypothetical protein [Ignavibacteriales bacterium]